MGRLYGRVPEELANLHLDECELPCWRGIEPQQTTLEETITIVSKKYRADKWTVESFEDVSRILRIHEENWGIFIHFGKHPERAAYLVDSIAIGRDQFEVFTKDSVNIGYLSQVIGPLEEIALGNTYYRNPSIALFLKNRSVFVTLHYPSFNGVKVDQPVTSIWIYGKRVERDLPLEIQTWRGYKTCYEFEAWHDYKSCYGSQP